MTRVYVVPLAEHPLASTAWTTIGNDPLCVVVPDSVPFAASVKLDGSVLKVVNVTAPMVLVAVKFCENATLTAPVLVAGVLTGMIWQLMGRGECARDAESAI